MSVQSLKEKFPPMVILSGLIIGVLGGYLALKGNPGNMGVCMACFVRDISGALGFHRAAVVQYLRPEILGMILGAGILGMVTRETVARSGSGPAMRFVLSVFVMIGALVFLGCPTRMVLRIGGGDVNALVGLAGFTVGIVAGTLFLKRGTTLGRSHKESSTVSSWIMPLLALAGIAMLYFKPDGLFFSEKGPGAMHASVKLSLAAGLIVGILAQRSRLCFAGGIRDMLLFKSPHLLSGFVAVLIGAVVVNAMTGRFNWGIDGQPAAHTVHLWNFLGMALVGLGSLLLGGCPFRQIVLAAQGNGDSIVAVLGLLTGAAICHNFKLAATPKGVSSAGMWAVGIGLAFCVIVALRARAKQ